MTMKNREKQAPASLAERLREMPLTVANYKLMLGLAFTLYRL